MADAAADAAAPDPAGRGTLTISDRAVQSLVEIAATEVAGVAHGADSGAGRTLRSDLPSASVLRAGNHARLAVEVAVSWPSSLARVTAEVRDHVIERVAELLPITVDRVDVSVPRLVTTDGEAL